MFSIHSSKKLFAVVVCKQIKVLDRDFVDNYSVLKKENGLGDK